MTIPAVRPDLVDRLRAELGHPAAHTSPLATPRPRFATLRRSVPAPARRAARRLIGRAFDTVANHVAPRLAPGVRHQLQLELQPILPLAEAVAEMSAGLSMVAAEMEAVRQSVESSDRTFRDIAEAIAPTAGIAGVGERFAELRERVNAIERRTRGRGGAAAASTDPAPQDTGSGSIDYVGFERRFRGDPEKIRDLYRDRYVPLLTGHGPVLDIGCGKGEMLDSLRQAGIDGIGVDLDRGMVDEARARGLDVHSDDALNMLAAQPAHSLGAIISVHVVEHVPIEYLVRMLELAASRLRPGGVFVAETPNPMSLVVLGTHFILDPTHIRPIHPGLMVFLAESAGFRNIELKFFSPATQYHLPPVQGEDLPPWVEGLNLSFERLNQVLFGPQEYAVIATTPG